MIIMFTGLRLNEMRKVFLSIPVATCLLDKNLRFVIANEKFAATIGAPLNTLKGREMKEFAPPEWIDLAQKNYLLLDRGETIPDHEVSLGGRTWLASLNMLPWGPRGSTKLLSVALVDITEQKNLEAELASSNEKLAMAYEKIQAQAETDPLTGLLNRYGLRKALELETRRCRRGVQSLSLAMIDVDWFKPYNDRYGHIIGDAALQAVGAAIKSSIRRPGDWAARYGGEEFVIVLPNTPLAGAKHVLAAMTNAVRDLAIEHGASPLGRLSVSVGIACTDTVQRDREPNAVYELLLREADKALYEAKEKGRNRIEVIGSDPPDNATARGSRPASS
ncbi:sensor domain-containing diguanylate cyclase [Sphingobium lactosutens]|uniref:diguanylate cyclase n=1 Tax=Sphingobium lactosutens DS20 TaxID=1331060 RepID=T0HS31_9SPHN|nr:diguanylate cyclase [Sphingobium lactosutens]EQB14928.1 hypothetical protein RLDS_12215 [Sphingobium lactosutens DS20]